MESWCISLREGGNLCLQALAMQNTSDAEVYGVCSCPTGYPIIMQLRHVPDLCRGILFHGEPGTGKTLAARALAGACARQSPKPVAFFSRKGADCLGKFSGEAERTLRLLFEEVGQK